MKIIIFVLKIVQSYRVYEMASLEMVHRHALHKNTHMYHLFQYMIYIGFINRIFRFQYTLVS